MSLTPGIARDQHDIEFTTKPGKGFCGTAVNTLNSQNNTTHWYRSTLRSFITVGATERQKSESGGLGDGTAGRIVRPQAESKATILGGQARKLASKSQMLALPTRD